MNPQLTGRALVACFMAIFLVSLATPAFAQLGTLKGKVVDTEGKPVPDAEMVFEFVGGYNLRMTARTNKNGDWVRSGMQAGSQGHWNITVTKGDLGARVQAQAAISETVDVPNIVLRSGGAAPGGAGPAETKEAAATRAMATAVDKSIADANTAINAKNYDAAITTLSAATVAYPKCAQCFAKLGQVQTMKGDQASAEAAYLKAMEADPKMAAVYDALASLYNQQKKFDEAAKMSAKASELHGASGGGDATSAFNAGVINWNAGKMAEAKVQFERAVQLDPKMAEAHYYFGMTLANEGKVAEAKKALEQYIALAPAGKNAATAKAILAELK